METKKKYTAVMGLEIHAQLKTKTKLFSPDSAEWTEGANDQIHPVSFALPGTLPVLNKEALQMALKTALAFKGAIQDHSLFARKNYFYPDLPKGYQISQHDKPFCKGGRVDFFLKGERRSIALERIHLEEDAGRSLHKADRSLINFNRAGVPLLEIVTQPEIRSPEEAAACARAIRRLLRSLKVCDGNMEEGSLRCDCNISLRPVEESELGTKIELKNLNSFRFMEKALNYEIKRQGEILNSGLELSQETRLYDSAKNKTFSMRTKESSSDYRYFSDPDLPAIALDKDWLKNLRLPELPFDKTERLIKEFSLKPEAAEMLVEDERLSDSFEQVTKLCKDPQITCKWFLGELKALMKEKREFCPIPPKDFARLLILILKGEISNKAGKEVFAEMWETGGDPETIVKQKGLRQISDEKKLREFVDKVLSALPDKVKEYRQGRLKLLGFFAGQVMKESKGRANPQKLSQILKQRLDSKDE